MDETNIPNTSILDKFNEMAIQESTPQTELESFEDSKSKLPHIEKKLPKTDLFVESEMHFKTSIQSKAPLSSTLSIFSPIIQCDSAARTHSANVRSAEEVSTQPIFDHIIQFDTSTRTQSSKVRTTVEASTQSVFSPIIQFDSAARTRSANFRSEEELSTQSILPPLVQCDYVLGTQSLNVRSAKEVSTQSVFPPIIQRDSATGSHSSTVRSAEEVLKHFRSSLSSNTESFRPQPDEFPKEDINYFSKSEIPSLKPPLEVATEPVNKYSGKTEEKAPESDNQDLKKFDKAEIEWRTAQISKKEMNEKPINWFDNSTTLIRYIDKIPMRSKVCDGSTEMRWRCGVIQQIKHKKLLLKSTVLEGKYLKDKMTQMICMEEAENIQLEIEKLLNSLEENVNVKNIPERFKHYSDPIQKDVSRSATDVKNTLVTPKSQVESLAQHSQRVLLRHDTKTKPNQIESFFSLFLQIYKSSNSESKNEDMFERIYETKLKSAFDVYLESKKKNDHECKLIQDFVTVEVNRLNVSLLKYSSKGKCKVPHPKNISLGDYQNYINHLKMALNENQSCLLQLLPSANFLLFHLSKYLTKSFNKRVKISTFLKEDRSEVFSKSPNENKTFFEDFCLKHFKN